jgi:NAD(P)-dependent dehydrogenase (short-subunit alcohol dehydrogenase family)
LVNEGGRVVLITGGAGGIGTAIGERFLALGDTIVLADIKNERPLLAVRSPTHVSFVVADVSKVAECERSVAEAISRRERLDVVINAAGVWTQGDTWRTTEADWDRTIDVNLKGTFFTSRFAIPELMRSHGCIINISSDSGLAGNAGCAVYNASKFGVNGITKSLALELAPYGVRVNSICPADVDTPMLEGQARDFGAGDPQRYLSDLLAKMPQGEQARFIRADEIAALAVFLASPEAAPITGACIPVDWGVTAGY